MGGLKPIGSEKLTGQDKLKRIMEIATYKEAKPANINESSSTEYSRNLADGNEYQIVKEKSGYIIKKTITESETDYIEPMKNRKYFPSYSQALKRLNLMAKEINRLNENEEEVSMFGEQKKFVLKTPKMEPEMEEPAAPPAEPPSVPSPELPVSDTEMPSDDEVDVDTEIDTDISEPEMDSSQESGEVVTFKTIQKLTGKLTQKVREFESEEGMTSEDIKYVINMVLSSLELNNLSDEDREDILSKFEFEDGDEMVDDEISTDEFDSPEDDVTSDTEVEKIQAGMDVPIEGDMRKNHGAIMDGIFGESKIDKLISKYFEYSDVEKKQLQEKKEEMKIRRKSQLTKKMESVKKLSESVEQELSSKKFLEENTDYTFLGKTNKKNLVFENQLGQVKISPEGLLL
jgi:hypothetical protein